MKFTCLSKGGNFYFPPCHIITVSGFRILLDCPMDLSSLLIFSPIPTDDFSAHEIPSPDSVEPKRQKLEKPIDSSQLIRAQPWFKAVATLHLWNVPFIDVVLISSPMGMLGLPFLTRASGFCAKIYVTEVAARIGQLMMEDLVSMNKEFTQFYGCEESGLPQWMKWEELESLPPLLREMVLGDNGAEFGGWVPLYSADDVKDCMWKVHTLKYAQEVCYNGTLIIRAFSSGLEIGTCNWTIYGPKGNIACLSSSVFDSAHAMNFDYHALEGNDLIIYSDFSSPVLEDVKNDSSLSEPTSQNFSALSYDSNEEAFMELLLNADESLEEMEKLDFICSCVIDCVKAGGSVLIPIGRLGIILQLLEQISSSLEASSLEVPIFIVSSVAEELLAFTNIIPEWLCKQRQEKLFAGEPLFAHKELVNKKKLHVFPAVYSPDLLKNWQEPCIVFSPHWNMRLGPVVHLLRRWCGDENSLLIMEEGLDAGLALLPFKPMAMKVLQCSFLSGIKVPKVQPLLKILQPKFVLFPEDLRQQISYSDMSSPSFFYYCENETLRVPSLKDSSELKIAADSVSRVHCRRLEPESMNIGRLKGELIVDHGKHQLCPGNEQADSSRNRPLLHWGSLDLEKLLTVLEKMGIKGSVEQSKTDTEPENAHIVHVHVPNKALIEVRENSTIISASTESLSSLIFEAVGSILPGI